MWPIRAARRRDRASPLLEEECPFRRSLKGKGPSDNADLATPTPGRGALRESIKLPWKLGHPSTLVCTRCPGEESRGLASARADSVGKPRSGLANQQPPDGNQLPQEDTNNQTPSKQHCTSRSFVLWSTRQFSSLDDPACWQKQKKAGAVSCATSPCNFIVPMANGVSASRQAWLVMSREI